MSAITPEEAWDLAGIKGVLSEHEQKIKRLIPVLENWACKYLNNYFHTPNWISSNNISFTADSTISEGNNSLLDEDIAFSDGMSLHIEGSILNDKVVTVKTVAAGTLTLEDGGLQNPKQYVVVNESFETMVTLYRMQWPEWIKLAFAKAIEYDLGMTRAVVEAPARRNPGDTDKKMRYPMRIMEMFGKPKMRTV